MTHEKEISGCFWHHHIYQHEIDENFFSWGHQQSSHFLTEMEREMYQVLDSWFHRPVFDSISAKKKRLTKTKHKEMCGRTRRFDHGQKWIIKIERTKWIGVSLVLMIWSNRFDRVDSSSSLIFSSWKMIGIFLSLIEDSSIDSISTWISYLMIRLVRLWSIYGDLMKLIVVWKFSSSGHSKRNLLHRLMSRTEET